MLNSPLVVRSAWKTFYSVLDVADLEFSITSRGGFESATFTMSAWVDDADPALTPGALITIEDTRNGEVVWQGYLDIPGKTREDAGESWQVGATGAKVVLGDRQRPWTAVDTSLEGWERKYTGAPGSTASVATRPSNENTAALLMQFPAGQPIDNSAVASMTYDRLSDAEQFLGSIQATREAGANDSDYRLQVSIPGGATLLDAAFDTTPNGPGVREAGPDFGTSEDAISLRIAHASGGATTVGFDNKWGTFYDICVRALLTGLDGTEISGVGTYTDPFVLAHEAIVDALYWFTNKISVANADIYTGFTHEFDQLAFPDGTHLPEVLDAIATMEPDMVWKVGPAPSQGGSHQFALAVYPTTARYSIDGRDGWSNPGSEADLANRVRVYWTDKQGNTKSKPYTTIVPSLGTREVDAEPVTLGSQIGSTAAADKAGPAILAQMTTVPYSGTMTVGYPVRDLVTGAWTQPWEDKTGEMVLLADLPDAPLVRCNAMSFRDSDMSATLTMGVPVLTTDQISDKFANKPRTRFSWSPIVIT